LLRALRLSSTAVSQARKEWLLYGCSLLVAVYTSLSTLSLILVQILYVAIVTRVQWSRTLYGFIVSLSAVGLLCLPWVLNLLRNFEAFSASMAWSSVIVIPRTAVLRILSLNVTRNVFDFWHRDPGVDSKWGLWGNLSSFGISTPFLVSSTGDDWWISTVLRSVKSERSPQETKDTRDTTKTKVLRNKFISFLL
jgi:hypothetical protein